MRAVFSYLLGFRHSKSDAEEEGLIAWEISYSDSNYFGGCLLFFLGSRHPFLCIREACLWYTGRRGSWFSCLVLLGLRRGKCQHLVIMLDAFAVSTGKWMANLGLMSCTLSAAQSSSGVRSGHHLCQQDQGEPSKPDLWQNCRHAPQTTFENPSLLGLVACLLVSLWPHASWTKRFSRIFLVCAFQTADCHTHWCVVMKLKCLAILLARRILGTVLWECSDFSVFEDDVQMGSISQCACVQTRFAHDERVYKAFLEILNMYRKGTKTIADVYHEVKSWFMFLIVIWWILELRQVGNCSTIWLLWRAH